ncbi:MAG: phosphatase PAP2 family protein [Candidatus Saliniplasma sp.]
MEKSPSTKSYAYRNFVLALSFMISFSILTGLVSFGFTNSVDVSILHFMVNYSESLPRDMTILFDYTDIPIYLTFATGIIFFIRERSYHKMITYLSMVAASLITYSSLKLLIGRTRPSYFLFYRSSFAYPSGHATMSFTVFIGIYVLYCSYKEIEHHWPYLILFSTASVITAYSRVFVGFHYITDIIAGYLLAAAIVVLVPTLFQYPFIKKPVNRIGIFLENNIIYRFRK